jgi:hypothetical protein
MCLDKIVRWGVYEQNEPLETLAIPGPARNEEDDATRWAMICAATQHLHVAHPSKADTGLWPTLASFPGVQMWGAELQSPVYGELPEGFQCPPEPPETTNYDHLLSLFHRSGLTFDEASSLRLLTYLLTSFDARCLTMPAPLLLVDSWSNAVGKTEVLSAVGTVLDTECEPVPVPRDGSIEEIVAYLIKGRRFLMLDNLTGARSWNHPWAASQLTERATSARAKYDRTASCFRGVQIAVSGIYGGFSLHPDMVSRTWRVQLWGAAKPLAHRPNHYAREHLARIRSEAYWAVVRARKWELPPATTSRAREWEEIGLAAAAVVLGKEHAELAAAMARADADTRMVSPAALNVMARDNNVEWADGPVTTQKQPRLDERNLLLGGRAMGYEVQSEDQKHFLVRTEA